jgi:hypothetical protein
MFDFDEIRKEVAIKHGVVLDKDDPVLATVTINEHVLSRYVEILTSQNEAHQRACSAALAQGVDESRKIAGRIVTEGANYVSEQCKTAIAEAMTQAVKEARAEIKDELVGSKKAIEVAKRSGLLNGWLAASLTTLALVVLLKVFM